MNTHGKKELRDILAPIESDLKAVDRSIIDHLTTGIPLLDEGAAHLFIRGGKKLRASIVLLASGMNDGSIPDGAISLAAAVEIIHAATLVHDDIIDKALLRRGNVTVSEKWGNKVAVLLGDYMYTAALEVTVRDENKALFPFMVEGTRDMVKGELYQLQYSNLDSITEDHYFRIIKLKTAQFMSTCARLGAMKGKMSPSDCDNLGDFGLNLGYAFQIVDDTLDLVEDSSETGKDVGNDFEDGKITLPFLHYIRTGGEKAAAKLKEYATRPDDEGFRVIRKELMECGAIEYSMGRAREFIDRGRQILSSLPGGRSRDILGDIADFIINRDY